MEKENSDFTDIIILCIGTNKLAGDLVGPMVGDFLGKSIKTSKENIVIYGNMKETLNLKNVKQVLENEMKKYKKPFIITIDAALGKTELTTEQIFVGKGKIQIGSCLGKGIDFYSDLYIKGVVGKIGNSNTENIEILSNVERKVVYHLAKKITNEIYKIIETINIV